MRSFLSLALVFLALAISLPAATEDLNATIAKANSGNADAQYKLATMYSNGQGAPRDLDQAFAWFAKAAKQGHKDAMHSLAIAYYNGNIFGGSTGRDIERAWIWFTMAAETGDTEAAREANRVAGELGRTGLLSAQNGLADLLLAGEEAPRDVPKALKLLEGLAATEPSAALRLAGIYEKGVAVQMNGEKAVYWLKEASRNAMNPEAVLKLARIYLDGKLVPLDAEAANYECQKVSRYPDGMICMAMVAERRSPPDYEKRATWYKKAADAGSFYGMIQYGRVLLEGKGVKQDFAKAYYWLSIAAIGSNFPETKGLREDAAAKLSPSEIAKQDRAVTQRNVVPYPEKWKDRPSTTTF